MTGWILPHETQKGYLEACQRAATDDESFSEFRSKPPLLSIWGHIQGDEGQEYFDAIIAEGHIARWAMDEIVEMNNIGSPHVFSCDGMILSPTAFRYLYVVSGLMSLPKQSAPLSIIEVGGGYGGLAATAKKFLDVEDYTIVDFHEAGLLQQRYLRECDIDDVTTLRAETFECHLKDKYDVFISNYSLDEFNEPTQERYIQHVVSRCRHGYVTVNIDKDRLRDLLPCTDSYPEPGNCHPEVMRW